MLRELTMGIYISKIKLQASSRNTTAKVVETVCLGQSAYLVETGKLS